MKPKQNKKQLFQYGLGALLLLTTVFCVWLVAVGRPALQRSPFDMIEAMSIGLISLVGAIGKWKVFEKAGQPGWGCIVPIYNYVLLLRVARRPWWFLLIYLIPGINLIPFILVPLDVARHFDKSGSFGLGLLTLGIVFYPILGFGDARYGPSENHVALAN